MPNEISFTCLRFDRSLGRLLLQLVHQGIHLKDTKLHVYVRTKYKTLKVQSLKKATQLIQAVLLRK